MSNRLGGRQGTAYLGTNAIQPPDYTFSDRSPTQYDINNVSVGDFWLNQTNESLWVLVSLAGDSQSKGPLATWSKLEAGGISALNELTGNTGGPITADINANINIVGDGVGIIFTGNPATNTLTASLVGGGEAAESFPTDAGTATPVNGVLSIIADTASINAGSTVSFSGAGNIVTFNVTDANDNTIIGKSSGNAAITGGDNTVIGQDSAFSLTTGSDNTILGRGSAQNITSGSSNIIIGRDAGDALTANDSNNTLIGDDGFAGASEFVVISAGTGGTPAFHNYPGVNASTTNGGNTFVGAGAGNFTLAGGAGQASNNGFGDDALNALTSGFNNNAMGVSALNKVTTGTNNIGIGHNAGFNSGGNTGLVSGTLNVLIGSTAGSNYTTNESSNIIIGSALGTLGESNVLRIGNGTGGAAGQLNKSFISGVYGITPTVNDGVPVFINSLGQLGTVGSGGATSIETVTGNTGGAVGPLAGNINIVGDNTSIAITGNPGTNTLTVAAIGGPGGLSTLTGDSGGAISPMAGNINVIANNAGLNAGSSVSFSGASNTLTFNVTDASSNTIIGFGAGNLTLTGPNNTGIGSECLPNLTSGTFNTVLGVNTGDALTTGSFNILLGADAGSNYANIESNNILIGSLGVLAETHALHIGDGTGGGLGQLNKAFISGIVGITPATADGIPVFIGSDGQLGTVGSGGSAFVSTVTGNVGGAVSPTAGGNLNIVGDGTTIVITGTPGSNTLTVVGLGGGGGTLSQIDGDTGMALPALGIINIIADVAAQGCGSTVAFDGSGNTIELSVTDIGNNVIIGGGSGNATLSATNNTVLGTDCAIAFTTATSNLLFGRQTGSLITTGSNNFLAGDASLATVLKGTTTSTGLYGFGIGSSVFLHNWGGSTSGNTFVGSGSGGVFNAGQQAADRQNTACGAGSLFAITTGSANLALGYSAGSTLTTGINNTLIGIGAGFNYTTSESSNICIGGGVFGTISESNALRIGTATGTADGQLNKSFIQGIYGISPVSGDGIPVFIGSTGQLGTAGNGGSALVSSLMGNSGGFVDPTLGNINIVGDGTSITVVGNPGTSTLTISAVGGGGGGLTTLTGDNGSALESAGVINVIAGTSTQECGSTVAFDGSSNTLELSVTDISNNTIIGGGSGNATLSGTNNTVLGVDCATAFTTASSNILFGRQTGSFITTGTDNFLAGDGSLAAVLKGTTNATGFYAFGIGADIFFHNWGGQNTGNTFVGAASGNRFNVAQQSSGQNNTTCGANSLPLLTTGFNNTVVGASSAFVTTGSNNTLLGTFAGDNYASSESSNICIGSNVSGTASESHVMRIGVGTGTGAGQLNKTFIAGIRGITTGISNAIPVVIDSLGQLGTAGGSSTITTLTGNSGGAVSATGGNINIRGDGTTVNVSGNPGTSTLTISAAGGAGGGPSFFAYLTNNRVNVTGDGTVYTVIYDTLPYNLGSGFNLGTSVFTAPVTGFYNFSYNMGMAVSSTLITRTYITSIVTTGRKFNCASDAWFSASSSTIRVPSGNIYTTMTAGDTAYCTVIVELGSKTVSVLGSGGPPAFDLTTFFSGTLI
jgi:hypothetical protein